jgi:hypothetical protein
VPFSLNLQLPKFITSTAWSAAAAGVLGVILGALWVSKPLLVGALVALVLAAVGVYVALKYPEIAFGGLIGLMALIPTYAAPKVGSLLFFPAAGACWLLVIVLAWRNLATKGRIMRLTSVDFTVLLFFALMAISLAFSPRTSFSDYKNLLFIWFGPYLGVRLLLSDCKHPVKVVSISFALAMAVLAPIAVSEVLGGSNPFFNLDFNSTEFNVWASQIARFGQTRAVASFGHPIAFSMFLAAAALFCLAMALSNENRNHRFFWYGLGGVAIAVQALALSRTGWVMIAIGIVAMAAVSVKGPIRRRLVTLFLIAAGVVLVVSVVMPHELSVLPGFGHKTESNYATSGLYREKLLERALEGGVLHPWGNATNQVTPYVDFGTATDNAYIILADLWGLIPTFALLAIAGSLIYTVGRAYGQEGEMLAILPIVAFTALVAIFFVAFITQQQVMIWMLIGAAAVAAERVSANRRRERAQRRSRVRGRV